jgi:ribosome-associated protein
MIRITERISIDESELDLSFIRASGPGGQHVNKSATAVQLRFDVANSPSLPAGVRQRLIEQAGNRMTQSGVLVIDASEYRSQTRNREEAIRRLKTLIRQAAHEPKRRRKTRVPKGAQERRLENKRRRSEKKRFRKTPRDY